MRITLSFATTADHYLDDRHSERLIISTPNDWDAVRTLRRAHDAILIGAETLRRDNPALRDVPTRVIVTCSGAIDPALRIFHTGSGRCIVISAREIPQLKDLAEVIVCPAPITATRIVTELERRGIRRLMVEGGASILHQFIEEGLADEVRWAINPTIVLGERLGYAPFTATLPAQYLHQEVLDDGMEIYQYTLHEDYTEEELHHLSEAIELSRNCPICDTCYRVGAVITTLDGGHYVGYTHESSPTHHAEQEALLKALKAGAELRGATIYSSMEPCSKRSSEPASCTELILRYGFQKVVFAAYEPSLFVCCEGACTLRQRGVVVRVYSELEDEVLRINSHLFCK